VESAVAQRIEEAGLDRLMEYTVEITTVPEIADPDYLDRLAEIVYEIPLLVDPLLGLNEDGSITASFCVATTNPDPVAAAGEAVYAFVQAVAAASPLQGQIAGATVGHIGISLVQEPEKVPA
jgi:thiazole synthase ThiGH ThiG subunit